MEQLLTNTEPSPDWERIRPILDEALDSLDDEDREAVLLRYFQKHDFRALGLALGVSDDTAQKRVSRAVEQLRGFFAKRKVAVGAPALALLLSSQGVQAAPAGLAAAASAAAITGATTATTTAAVAAAKAVGMTALQKVLVTSTIAALAGFGLYEARQVSQLREQVSALQAQAVVSGRQLRQNPSERQSLAVDSAPIPTDKPANQNTGISLSLPDAGQPLPGLAAGTSGQQFLSQAQRTAEHLQEQQRQFVQASAGSALASSTGAFGFVGAGQASAVTLATKTVNGNTVIVYLGREFPVGTTRGAVSTKAVNIQGEDYAAAFDGDRVIWENVPGAAQRVR